MHRLIERAANIDIKSKAPNGVSFNVKGKSAHEGKTAGSVRPALHIFYLSNANDTLPTAGSEIR